MPHYSNYSGTRFSAQPEKESFHTPFGTARFKESFGSFEPREVESVDIGQPPDPEIGGLKGEFQADELTGEGRPMNSWRNADPSPFEDRWEFLDTGYDLNVVEFGNRIDADIQRPTHPNDNVGTNSGPGGSTFMTEVFEPAAGMDSFGNSRNPVLEIAGTAGPGGSTYMTGQFEMPNGSARHRLTVDVWY